MGNPADLCGRLLIGRMSHAGNIVRWFVVVVFPTINRGGFATARNRRLYAPLGHHLRRKVTVVGGHDGNDSGAKPRDIEPIASTGINRAIHFG